MFEHGAVLPAACSEGEEGALLAESERQRMCWQQWHVRQHEWRVEEDRRLRSQQTAEEQSILGKRARVVPRAAGGAGGGCAGASAGGGSAEAGGKDDSADIEHGSCDGSEKKVQVKQMSREHCPGFSKYRGVTRDSRKGSTQSKLVWQAQITYGRQNHYLGKFDTEEQAAAAYDAAARKHHGAKATLNFAEKLQAPGQGQEKHGQASTSAFDKLMRTIS